MGIGEEAGARCRWKPRANSLNLGLPGTPLNPDDGRVLDFAAFGLSLYGGLTVVADATLVSPSSADGIPHPGCEALPDAVFGPAEDQCVRDYGDLARGGRAALLCLASSTGGRWNATALGFVRALVLRHAQSQPAVLRRSVELALTRRWWSVLAIARDEAIAASLDPADVVDERGLAPVAPLDVWLRDPPGPSVQGLR